MRQERGGGRELRRGENGGGEDGGYGRLYEEREIKCNEGEKGILLIISWSL